MLSQDEQIALFVDAINKNALKMCREIEKETKKLYSDEAQKLENAARLQLKEKLSFEESRIMTELNRKSASEKSLFRHELYSRREELTGDVFKKAGKLLSDFASSEAYIPFLEKSLENISSFTEEKITVLARSCDKEKVALAARKLNINCLIESDDTILLGGIKAKAASGLLNFDDTLDERLSEQKDWFLFHTGKELNI